MTPFARLAFCVALVSPSALVMAETAPAKASLAEQIVLTPQRGDGVEDQQIARWQDAAGGPRATSAAFENLAWAYIAKARRTLDAGYYKLAEQTAAAMDARYGVSPESRLIRGHVLHNLHSFAAAEAIARQLVADRAQPNDYALLSDVLMEQGKLTEAVDALQQMVNLKPGVEAYGRIAHLRWLKGDLPGATQAMSDAAKAGSPRDAETYAWTLVRLSSYHLQGGQGRSALALADAALKAAPGYAPALLARGRALLAEKNISAALAVLQDAEARNPLPEYQWWLADVLRLAGQAEAATLLEAKLRAQGEAADPRTLALFLATRGEESARSVQLAEQELTIRADVFTHDALAWALVARGDLPAAEVEMQAALKEKTADARLYLHAGTLALRRGSRATAKEFFERALPLAQALTPSEAALLTHALAESTLAAAR